LEKNHGEGGSSFVQLRPTPSTQTDSISVNQFLASVRFEHKSKLDQLGIEISSLDSKIGK
jgi:hypothetical protein